MNKLDVLFSQTVVRAKKEAEAVMRMVQIVQALEAGNLRSEGLRCLSADRWFGPGYCGVCGDARSESLIPRAVRYWDPDDGWRSGVLCLHCAFECANRGPRAEDYASSTNGISKEEFDVASTVGDLDADLLD